MPGPHADTQEHLAGLLGDREDWLMGRILEYARAQGYTRYTSTLPEAWRLSIEGLSESVQSALATYDEIPELDPDEDYGADPCAQFGIAEAERHRARGIDIGMFLGLFKYYRKTYQDLVAEAGLAATETQWAADFMDRVFDRVELGFCLRWTAQNVEDGRAELEQANRQLANEKNRYLTVFESLGVPVILTDPEGRAEIMNHAAAQLFRGSDVPGEMYYEGQRERTHVPWLQEELAAFRKSGEGTVTYEKEMGVGNARRHFKVTLARMLDVSQKFMGFTVILNDLTARKQVEDERERLIAELRDALDKIKTLRGLIPICSACKKVRRDSGFWEQIDVYVRQHSDAQFSHSLCPDCLKRLYPDQARHMNP
jgi:PAS domain S-box-containing protein